MDATCERCSKSFRTYPSRVRDGKARYCSKPCQFSESLADRFWRFVDKSTECWLWTGRRNAGGYGTFKIGRVSWLAHRVAWMLSSGNAPTNRDICHQCDTRACVRPDHLFAGTALDNIRDMHAKGRNRPPTISHRQRDQFGRFLPT